MSKPIPFQFLDVPRRLPQALSIEARLASFEEIHGHAEPAQVVEQAARCLDCGNPYCSWQCPVHNDIPNWLSLLREGRLFEAAELAHETNPLPEICGRVCPQDRLCEGACTIQVGFEAVTIGALEKYLVDEAFQRGWRPDLSTVKPLGQRVAIIGAGPAGLACADRLVRAGVDAEVFDRYEQIGGLLSFGIPAFKLEKSVIATRRAVLEAMGVVFHLGVEVGRDRSIESLLAEFDAVFIATGAYRYVDGRLPGQDLPGVMAALPFLVSLARRGKANPGSPIAGYSGPAPELDMAGKRVLVLGGGDTAMDCVRSAVRLGAGEVVCAYRREEDAMPGSRREVRYAREEGVAFRFSHQPLAIAQTESGLSVRFAPVHGRAIEIEADVVLLAFGFRADPPAWLDALAPERDEAARLMVGHDGRLPFQTRHPRLFAGGDVVRGADLVVNAVYDGREAAASILRSLRDRS